MKGYLLLSIAIVAEVIATSVLPLTKEFTKIPMVIVVVLGYVLSFYFMSLSLKYIPLAISYSIWSGIGMVCLVIIGWHFYEEKLDPPSIIGVSFIIGGVLIINLFSKLNTH